MRKGLIAAALLLTLGALLWWWEGPQPLPVGLLAARRGPGGGPVANSRAGTLKACRRSQLSFNLGAPVAERLVTEGERVQAGQVLMRLRQDDQQARLAEAEARLLLQRNARVRQCAQAELGGRAGARPPRLAARPPGGRGWRGPAPPARCCAVDHPRRRPPPLAPAPWGGRPPAASGSSAPG